MHLHSALRKNSPTRLLSGPCADQRPLDTIKLKDCSLLLRMLYSITDIDKTLFLFNHEWHIWLLPQPAILPKTLTRTSQKLGEWRESIYSCDSRFPRCHKPVRTGEFNMKPDSSLFSSTSFLEGPQLPKPPSSTSRDVINQAGIPNVMCPAQGCLLLGVTLTSKFRLMWNTDM